MLSISNYKENNKIELLFFIILILLYTLVAILNIPLVRQIIGFILYTVYIGWIILDLLNIEKLIIWEKIVISFGISTMFIMIFGGAINFSYYALGYKTPLSSMSLLLSINSCLIILTYIRYVIKKKVLVDHKLKEIIYARFDVTNLTIMLSLILPVLAWSGCMLMNSYENNKIIYLVLIFIVVLLIVFIMKKNLSVNIYSTGLWGMGLGILLIYSLRSNHILGYDVHDEYLIFQTVVKNSYWNIYKFNNILNTCFSVGILPTFYQSVLNIKGEYVYKTIFPLIISPIPVIIFLTAKKYVHNYLAFISSFFYISQTAFSVTTQSNSRTAIAILFFTLLIHTIFNDKIHGVSREILFLIFVTGVVISHYTTAIISLIIILVGFIFNCFYRRETNKISREIIILFFSEIILWYGLITASPFASIVQTVNNLVINLGKLFVEDSRQQGTLRVMGIGVRNIGDKLYSLSYYMVSFVIFIGVIYIIYSKVKSEKNVLKKLELKYLSMIAVTCVLLISMMIVPYLSISYTPDRLWLQAMVLLSLPFGIGCTVIANLFKRYKDIIYIVVLLFYFINANYLIYQIIGIPYSLVYNSRGTDYAYLYVYDSEIKSAEWLYKNKMPHSQIYSDFDGGLRLNYTPIAVTWDTITFFQNNNSLTRQGYLYLNYYNVNFKKVYTGKISGIFTPIAKLSVKIHDANKIYDSNGSQIFKGI